MRILLTIPLLMVAACSADHDSNNDQVTINYDQEQAENTAAAVGDTLENVGEGIANEAERAVDKVENTDVDVNTNPDGNTQ